MKVYYGQKVKYKDQICRVVNVRCEYRSFIELPSKECVRVDNSELERVSLRDVESEEEE